MALVIALLGITYTLALSVFERTREIGLLRAVGMTRRQARSMIRWEAVIVSIIGALLGLAVGTFFGWALVTAPRVRRDPRARRARMAANVLHRHCRSGRGFGRPTACPPGRTNGCTEGGSH